MTQQICWKNEHCGTQTLWIFDYLLMDHMTTILLFDITVRLDIGELTHTFMIKDFKLSANFMNKIFVFFLLQQFFQTFSVPLEFLFLIFKCVCVWWHYLFFIIISSSQALTSHLEEEEEVFIMISSKSLFPPLEGVSAIYVWCIFRIQPI